jgi:hypothetical protein
MCLCVCACLYLFLPLSLPLSASPIVWFSPFPASFHLFDTNLSSVCRLIHAHRLSAAPSSPLAPAAVERLFDLLCADSLPVALSASSFVSHWLGALGSPLAHAPASSALSSASSSTASSGGDSDDMADFTLAHFRAGANAPTISAALQTAIAWLLQPPHSSSSSSSAISSDCEPRTRLSGIQRLLGAPMGADADARDSLEYVDAAGSAFGMPAVGALDAALHIMLVVVRHGPPSASSSGSAGTGHLNGGTANGVNGTTGLSLQSPSALLLPPASDLWELFARRVESVSVSNTLSMRGLAAALRLAHAALRSPWDAPARTVPRHLNDALLMGLIALMRESKLRRVAEWPARAPFGGGIVVRLFIRDDQGGLGRGKV